MFSHLLRREETSFLVYRKLAPLTLLKQSFRSSVISFEILWLSGGFAHPRPFSRMGSEQVAEGLWPHESNKRVSKIPCGAPGSLLVPTEENVSVCPLHWCPLGHAQFLILAYTTRDTGVNYLASFQNFYLVPIVDQPTKQTNKPSKEIEDFGWK